jgi:spermidine/putrescine transport system ATP-binding protein
LRLESADMTSKAPEFTNKNIAIDVKSLSKFFGGGDFKVSALDGVSVAIRENEFFTLLGPSGCGKTTLLRMIAGFDYPSEGQILLYGEDIASLPPFKRPINTVFQSYALFPHMTVAENIGFGLKMLGQSKLEIASRVSEMLRLVRMEELKDRRISQISGGQQQRVALARALAPRPKVLLLDEPLSALDYKLRKEMQIELKRLQHETGITFVFVTHDQEEALTMSDRIAVMNHGKILQIGSAREIYGQPEDRFVASFIGEANFLPCKLKRSRAGQLTAIIVDGVQVYVEDVGSVDANGMATLSIRPENAKVLSVVAKGTLQAVVENIIFIGTAIQIHTRLSDGTSFIARQQDMGRNQQLDVGQKVAIAIDAESARLVRD